MSKFPLYDSLSKDLPLDREDLSVIQKRAFIKRLEKIDKHGHELIYALIRIYQIENNEEDNTCFTLPYNGIYVETDIHFDLDNLPKDLKHILFKFVSIHLEKMKEEKQIVNNTPVKRI